MIDHLENYAFNTSMLFPRPGVPEPTVTWTHNGGPLPPTCQTSLVLNKVSLVIPSVTQPFAGRYTCAIDNDAGSSQCTCDLIVKSEFFCLLVGEIWINFSVAVKKREFSINFMSFEWTYFLNGFVHSKLFKVWVLFKILPCKCIKVQFSNVSKKCSYQSSIFKYIKEMYQSSNVSKKCSYQSSIFKCIKVQSSNVSKKCSYQSSIFKCSKEIYQSSVFKCIKEMYQSSVFKCIKENPDVYSGFRNMFFLSQLFLNHFGKHFFMKIPLKIWLMIKWFGHWFFKYLYFNHICLSR